MNLTNTTGFHVFIYSSDLLLSSGHCGGYKDQCHCAKSHESSQYPEVQGDLHDFCNIVFSVDCEHLIRRMLVLDPSKRLTIAQIKEHKWMLIEVPVQRPVLYPQGQENEPSIGEFNEQVLRLMHSLGIDQQKTIEVR